MGNVENLIGKRFGRWTILYRAEDKLQPSGQKKIMWHCICDCGNEKDVSSCSLKNGSSKSCGCLHRDIATEMSLIDLTGQKFGRWTVMYKGKIRTTPSGQKKTMWHCSCECGEERDVDACNLTSGASQSCGCLQKDSRTIDLSKRVYNSNGDLIQKLCPCCQEFVDISLFSKNKRRADLYNEYCNNCLKYDAKKRYDHYKHNAKIRKLCFDLSIDEFKDITSKPCIYCGEFSVYFNNIGINGIDRTNSSIGYTLKNVVPCCEMCNRMKLDYDVNQWMDRIIKIANRAKRGLINESKN